MEASRHRADMKNWQLNRESTRILSAARKRLLTGNSDRNNLSAFARTGYFAYEVVLGALPRAPSKALPLGSRYQVKDFFGILYCHNVKSFVPLLKNGTVCDKI